MNFFTYSLGCRTNQAEIEEISKELLQHGFEVTPVNHQPDLILINTCVVTQKAEKETRKEIRKFRRLYPKAFLAVLGCSVNAKERFKINLPAANLLIRNQDKSRVVRLILRKFPKMGATRLHENGEIRVKSKYHSSGRKLIKIQEGCNHFCSYCIVPWVRGKSKSRQIQKIINEIKNLANQEIKEVVLTGTNISQYGQDLLPKRNLLSLIEKILTGTEIPQISLTSIDPKILNKTFIDLFLKNPRLLHHLHFSLQSGSPTMLERMNRNFDLNNFTKLLKSLKREAPNFIFSADIIVGFPNETEEEFKETIQLIKAVKISKVHLFPFSTRPGTLAFQKIKNGEWVDLPLKTKKEREKIIGTLLPAG